MKIMWTRGKFNVGSAENSPAMQKCTPTSWKETNHFGTVHVHVHRHLDQWKAEVLLIKKAQAHAQGNLDTHYEQCFLSFDNGEQIRLDNRVNVYWCAKRSNLPLMSMWQNKVLFGCWTIATVTQRKEWYQNSSTNKLSPQCSLNRQQ